MKVVIDSNILFKDPWMTRSGFRILLGESDYARCQLVLPQVVVDESVNNLREELQKEMSRVANATNRIAALTNETIANRLDVEVSRVEALYRQHLHSTVESRSGEICDHPDVSHTDLVGRALARRKPFAGKGGAGYRDALIWHTVLRVAGAQDDPVALVTENKADFADPDGQLHPDLLDDLRARGINESRVVLYLSLEDFVNAKIKPHLELVQDTLDAFQAGNYPFDLGDVIVDRFQATYGGDEWEAHVVGAPEEYGTVNVGYVVAEPKIETSAVRRLNASELVVEVEAYLDVEFDVFVRKADLPLLDEAEMPFIHDWDWNDHVVAGTRSFPLVALIDLIYDVETNEVVTFNFTDIGPEEDFTDD